MAKAKKIEAPKVFEVQLTLSEAEANTLRDICDRIGGPAENTRRRHFDAIRSALSEAGVSGLGTLDIDRNNRAIYFQ